MGPVQQSAENDVPDNQQKKRQEDKETKRSSLPQAFVLSKQTTVILTSCWNTLSQGTRGSTQSVTQEHEKLLSVHPLMLFITANVDVHINKQPSSPSLLLPF